MKHSPEQTPYISWSGQGIEGIIDLVKYLENGEIQRAKLFGLSPAEFTRLQEVWRINETPSGMPLYKNKDEKLQQLLKLVDKILQENSSLPEWRENLKKTVLPSKQNTRLNLNIHATDHLGDNLIDNTTIQPAEPRVVRLRTPEVISQHATKNIADATESLRRAQERLNRIESSRPKEPNV